MTKSHRQIIGLDFYVENRPLPRNNWSATLVCNRACLQRDSVVVMSPVFSQCDHRELVKSLWEQMSGWR